MKTSYDEKETDRFPITICLFSYSRKCVHVWEKLWEFCKTLSEMSRKKLPVSTTCECDWLFIQWIIIGSAIKKTKTSVKFYCFNLKETVHEVFSRQCHKTKYCKFNKLYLEYNCPFMRYKYWMINCLIYISIKL